MRVEIVDPRGGGAETDAGPRRGWVRYSGPRPFPSPSLLHHAQQLAAAGAEVRFHHPDRQQLATLARDLAGCQRVLIAAPPVWRDQGEQLRTLLRREAPGPSIDLFDPWSADSQESAGQPFGYALASAEATGHAEVDALPGVAPVHPWVCPTRARHPVTAWEARLDAAVESLGAGPCQEPDLVLNDDRIPTTIDRIGHVAQQISRLVRDHETILKLHLRVWPTDILGEAHLVDNLTLLPVGSIEILVGSLLHRSREAIGDHRADDAAAALERATAAGLAPLCGLSVALGLPGESAEDCVESITNTLDAALRLHIPRVRFGMWLGAGAPMPRSVRDHRQHFLASHPAWHLDEYQGVLDYLAVIAMTYKGVEVVGPLLDPSWRTDAAEHPGAEHPGTEEQRVG
jgi:hypothetical protein